MNVQEWNSASSQIVVISWLSTARNNGSFKLIYDILQASLEVRLPLTYQHDCPTSTSMTVLMLAVVAVLLRSESILRTIHTFTVLGWHVDHPNCS